MAFIHTITPGMFTTIQDLGRPGHMAQAICRGGAADPLSHRLANRIAGNLDSEAAFECTLIGGTFLFPSGATIAIAGAICSPTIVGVDQAARPAPHSRRIQIQAGEQLRIGALTGGVRAYVAVRGGLDVPEVFGSRATHIAAKFGGFQGRALRVGDVIAIGSAATTDAPPIANWPKPSTSPHMIRAVDGAHQELFSVDARDRFWSTSFVVSNQSNRAGVRLNGPAIPTLVTGRLVSEGMAPGAVQIPENGNPIALGVDHPTTGGYPVIACIITADLHILGQVRPSDMLQFRRVTLEEARQALEVQRAMLDSGSTST